MYMNSSSESSLTFHGLGIAPRLLGVIHSQGFTTPTPIQKLSIPHAIEGKDVMGIAQTGTGKTLAFGIPLLQRLSSQGGRGLVVLPTRELALQVKEALSALSLSLGLKMVVLIGGESLGKQINALQNQPHVIIATPGRLIDHMNQKTVALDKVKILVLDEADHMLDMGFLPQIKRILERLPADRQTLCFSATMPEEIVQLVRRYMKLPVRLEVARSGTTAKDVSQEIFFVSKDGKMDMLRKLLTEYKGSVLIFCRTKFGAKKITRRLKQLEYCVAEIHSNRSLAQRKQALDGFKRGSFRILVATDIASRGIDVSGIELVLNYDLPSHPEDYVHRIGRTGRAGRVGHAISLATPDQKKDVKGIERLIRISIPISPLPQGIRRGSEKMQEMASTPNRGQIFLRRNGAE
jgi:ATP-dependent RNA helicase RhlE